MGDKSLLGNMGNVGSQGKGDGRVVGCFGVGVSGSVHDGAGGGLVRKWAARERSLHREVGRRRPGAAGRRGPGGEGW